MNVYKPKVTSLSAPIKMKSQQAIPIRNAVRCLTRIFA